ncbi:MAG: GIY-YIG nuclease family protein [Dehalococcoidales bacterium]
MDGKASDLLPKKTTDEAGTYALVIFAERPSLLTIGKLGTYEFPAGYYIYVGSALNGLNSRLGRHLKAEKKLHWHIDYLLRQNKVIQVWYSLSPDKLECKWTSILQGLTDVQMPVPGFGSSDCRCLSHLLHFSALPDFCRFEKELEERQLPEVLRMMGVE